MAGDEDFTIRNDWNQVGVASGVWPTTGTGPEESLHIAFDQYFGIERVEIDWVAGKSDRRRNLDQSGNRRGLDFVDLNGLSATGDDAAGAVGGIDEVGLPAPASTDAIGSEDVVLRSGGWAAAVFVHRQKAASPS